MPRGDAHPSLAGPWTEEAAERYLLGLELFGMRFGLDRMRRLLTTLGSPQERFGSIHVVGTNGKSSTVRMIAAILERHGLRTGAYLSPHLVSFSERIRVGERDLEPGAFAAAVRAAARAAAASAGARLLVAPADPGVPLVAQGDFQRGNFALARTAAQAYLGALDERAVRAAAAATVVPGRFQEVAADPPTVLDGAHNPGGIAALAASLPAYLAGRPLTAVVAILDDKDAA